MVKKVKSERGESDHKGKRVYERALSTKKYIECIFKWDQHFLFPI